VVWCIGFYLFSGGVLRMKNVKRKGFTLVELLIVIVIIGILAGAMMMLMGSSTDKAEATKVISDLRSMKGALLQYYSDHSGYPADGDVDDLGTYVDKDLSEANGYALKVGVIVAASSDVIFLGRQVPTAGAGGKLIEAVQRDNLNMWYGTSTSAAGTQIISTTANTVIDDDDWVFVQGN